MKYWFLTLFTVIPTLSGASCAGVPGCIEPSVSIFGILISVYFALFVPVAFLLLLYIGVKYFLSKKNPKKYKKPKKVFWLLVILTVIFEVAIIFLK